MVELPRHSVMEVQQVDKLQLHRDATTTDELEVQQVDELKLYRDAQQLRVPIPRLAGVTGGRHGHTLPKMPK